MENMFSYVILLHLHLTRKKNEYGKGAKFLHAHKFI